VRKRIASEKEGSSRPIERQVSAALEKSNSPLEVRRFGDVTYLCACTASSFSSELFDRRIKIS
jgi:hypothetical protein